MIDQIFTDVPPDQLDVVTEGIRFDNGTFTKEQQDDGNFTLFAQFPGDPPAEETAATGQEFAWMPIARAELGVAAGAGDSRISEYFETTSLGAQPSTVPWCSAFVNFCVVTSGSVGTNCARARSWLTWGRDAAGFLPGCIVVGSRGSPALGHVGFYVGDGGDDTVLLLGGNQHDSVNISKFPKSKVLGQRIPNAGA